MKNIIKYFLLLMIVGIVSSCKKDKAEPASEIPIDPADATALTRVVVLPDGSEIRSGNIPAATGGVLTPSITSLIPNLLTSNGATAPFLYRYTNAVNNLGGFYVQIEGADSYFRIPYTGSSSNSGQIDLPLGLPTNVIAGNFCLLFSVFDQNGRVSNTVRVCASVIRLGTGALQVSLTWNTATDQDLWVTDPSGEKIFYSNKRSATGGQLDRDDLDGYGPENIFWLADAPDGEYKVQVNDYENSATPNACYVTVSSPGKTKTFNITTQRRSTVTVVTIRKNGDNYDF